MAVARVSSSLHVLWPLPPLPDASLEHRPRQSQLRMDLPTSSLPSLAVLRKTTREIFLEPPGRITGLLKNLSEVPFAGGSNSSAIHEAPSPGLCLPFEPRASTPPPVISPSECGFGRIPCFSSCLSTFPQARPHVWSTHLLACLLLQMLSVLPDSTGVHSFVLQ